MSIQPELRLDPGVADGSLRITGRLVARRRIGVLVGAIALCVAVALSNDPNPPFVPPPGATSDLDLFRILVERVHAGEGYYDAAHREMVSHGYPTRSIFNWRSPVFAWVLGALPDPSAGRALLAALALVTVALSATDFLDDVGIVGAGVGVVSLVGATAWCFGGETYLFTEVWAGLLLAFSVAAMRRGWLFPGITAGVFALFVREFALPYIVVSLAIAMLGGRRREAIAWGTGLFFYAMFLGWHAFQALSRLTPADPGMAEGWVRFGGIRFLLSTAQANVFLMGMPLWCTAVYLPLAVLGLTSWAGESGRRVRSTTILYLLAFSVVGAPFNFYWGFVFGPLLALGAGHAPGALAEAFREAFEPVEGRPARPVGVATPAGAPASRSRPHTI